MGWDWVKVCESFRRRAEFGKRWKVGESFVVGTTVARMISIIGVCGGARNVLDSAQGSAQRRRQAITMMKRVQNSNNGDVGRWSVWLEKD